LGSEEIQVSSEIDTPQGYTGGVSQKYKGYRGRTHLLRISSVPSSIEKDPEGRFTAIAHDWRRPGGAAGAVVFDTGVRALIRCPIYVRRSRYVWTGFSLMLTAIWRLEEETTGVQEVE
jgi:hypothetical protein